MRIGHTFAYQNGSFRGLVKTRRAVIVSTFGSEAYLKGQPFEAANFVQPYLEFLLSFMGIRDIRFISAQGTAGDPETTMARIEAARQECQLAA